MHAVLVVMCPAPQSGQSRSEWSAEHRWNREGTLLACFAAPPNRPAELRTQLAGLTLADCTPHPDLSPLLIGSARTLLFP